MKVSVNNIQQGEEGESRNEMRPSSAAATTTIGMTTFFGVGFEEYRGRSSLSSRASDCRRRRRRIDTETTNCPVTRHCHCNPKQGTEESKSNHVDGENDGDCDGDGDGEEPTARCQHHE